MERVDGRGEEWEMHQRGNMGTIWGASLTSVTKIWEFLSTAVM